MSEHSETLEKKEKIEELQDAKEEFDKAAHSQEKQEEEPLNQQFISADPTKCMELKQDGNTLFKQEQYQDAISKYREALRYAPIQDSKTRAILYSNISICLSKLLSYQQAVKYCKKATKSDPDYQKAQLNLAIYHEKSDNLEQALVQNKKLLEKSPNDIKLLMKIKELEKGIQQKNEKQKKEVIDGLKNIGNSVLGYFGMSLDNFKMEQGSNGGYNVSFKQ